jgi:hypothetical protein
MRITTAATAHTTIVTSSGASVTSVRSGLLPAGRPRVYELEVAEQTEDDERDRHHHQRRVARREGVERVGADRRRRHDCYELVDERDGVAAKDGPRRMHKVRTCRRFSMSTATMSSIIAARVGELMRGKCRACAGECVAGADASRLPTGVAC